MDIKGIRKALKGAVSVFFKNPFCVDCPGQGNVFHFLQKLKKGTPPNLIFFLESWLTG